MLNLYRRAADFVNFMLTITLVIGCIELLCVHSALKEDGIYIGHPKTIIVHEQGFLADYHNAATDQRLAQLAAAVATTPARRTR